MCPGYVATRSMKSSTAWPYSPDWKRVRATAWDSARDRIGTAGATTGGGAAGRDEPADLLLGASPRRLRRLESLIQRPHHLRQFAHAGLELFRTCVE
jgi:hypothetical protein